MKGRPNLTSLLLFFLGPALFWYTYKDFEWESLKNGLIASKKSFILMAIVAHLITHAFRSWRWRMLLKSQGEKPSFLQAFLAEMSGFCVNAFPLRIGEFVRCKSLEKINKTPIKRSLAALIVERTVEMFSFGLIFLVSFFFFHKEVSNFINQVGGENKGNMDSDMKWLIASNIAAIIFLLYVVRKEKFVKKYWRKVVSFFSSLKEGFKQSLRAKSLSFWGFTALIWIFYFLLEYMCLFAFDETAAIATKSLAPAVCIFISLNLSHMVPTGNGMGAYHVLVISVLTSFGVSQEIAAAYALITHGIQTFNALVPGGLCFLAVFKWKRNKETRPAT